MRQSIYKKLFLTLFLLSLLVIFAGCDKYDDLPPKQDTDISGEYNTPVGKQASQSEKEIVDEIIKEYENSINL